MTRYAFFDVDETLIKIKSMFDFYQYWLRNTHQSDTMSWIQKYNFFLYQIDSLKSYKSREHINRFYYKQYKGIREDKLVYLGKKWWDFLSAKDNIFHEKILLLLSQHKKDGVKTVLISGSMNYCLEPLQKHVNADHVICTQLEITNGILTGNLINYPNIGEGKKKNILKFLRTIKTKADLKNSFAYGDHESDIPMLSLVGNSYWVSGGVPKKISCSDLINKPKLLAKQGEY